MSLRHTIVGVGAAVLGACQAPTPTRLPTAEEQVLIDRGMARNTVETDVVAMMMERSHRTFFDVEGNTIDKGQAVTELWDAHDALERYAQEGRFRMFDPEVCDDITTHVEQTEGALETEVLEADEVGGFASQREGGIIAFSSLQFDEDFLPDAEHEIIHAEHPDFHHSEEMSDFAFSEEGSSVAELINTSFEFRDPAYLRGESFDWVNIFISSGEYSIDYKNESVREQVSSGALSEEEALGEYDSQLFPDDPAWFETLIEMTVSQIDKPTASGSYPTKDYFRALGNSNEDVKRSLEESEIRAHFTLYRTEVRAELVEWLEARKEGEQKMMRETERIQRRR